MRNLKRALSLTLASVMLLGMMVVGAGAASYPDVDEKDNIEAIEVLQAVKVMVGDEKGNFGPDQPVNRAQMAVVMALLLDLDYDYYEGTNPFKDVPAWAAPYVAACYANGIVSGYDAVTYGSGDPVTAVQAASMMMRALGYFKYPSDYSNNGGFELATVKQASKIELFRQINANAKDPLTRNQVAQLALNALKTPIVEADDKTFNLVDGNGNLVVTGGQVNYVVTASNQAFARAIDDAESNGNALNGVNGYIIELGEKLYNGKLKLDNDATDPFDRPARKWEFDGKGVGTYAKKELLEKEYVGKVTGKDLYDLLGATTIKDYDLNVAIDGVNTAGIVGTDSANLNHDYVFTDVDMNKNNKAGVGNTGVGTLTQVYVDHEKDEVSIAIINTYLAIASKNYDDKKDETSISAYSMKRVGDEYVKVNKNGTSAATVTLNPAGEDFALVKDLQKDDAVLITVAEGDIQTIALAEVLESVSISAFKKKDNITVDGTKYSYTTTAGYRDGDLDVYTGNDGKENLKDRTYNVYLDTYGNLIGLKEVEAKKNYVFISAISAQDNTLMNRTADANAIFLDGTVDTIKVNMTKSTLSFSGGPNDAILNTWCTFTKSGDIYTLKEVSDVGVGNRKADGDFEMANVDTTKLPDSANKVKLAQLQIVYPDADYNNGKEIDTKHITLPGGARSTGDAYYNVYGNKDTVYLTAKLGELKSSGGNYGVIKDVANRTVGVEKASISVWNTGKAVQKADDTKITGTAPISATTSQGVYVLYDIDGIVIAAVVVGEDAGASKNLVYVHSSGLEEEVDAATGDGKAATGEDWIWYRKAIQDGQEVMLEEVGSESSYLENMVQYQWYEIKQNGDGEVVESTDAVTALASSSKALFVSDHKVVSTEIEKDNIDTVLYYTGKGLPGAGLTGEMKLQGNTLFVDTTYPSGFAVKDDVKAVLHQWNRNTNTTEVREEDGLDGLQQIINWVNEYKDAREENPYYVSAIVEKGGATVVVVRDTYNSYDPGDGDDKNKEFTSNGITLVVSENVKASNFAAVITGTAPAATLSFQFDTDMGAMNNTTFTYDYVLKNADGVVLEKKTGETSTAAANGTPQFKDSITGIAMLKDGKEYTLVISNVVPTAYKMTVDSTADGITKNDVSVNSGATSLNSAAQSVTLEIDQTKIVAPEKVTVTFTITGVDTDKLVKGAGVTGEDGTYTFTAEKSDLNAGVNVLNGVEATGEVKFTVTNVVDASSKVAVVVKVDAASQQYVDSLNSTIAPLPLTATDVSLANIGLTVKSIATKWSYSVKIDGKDVINLTDNGTTAITTKTNVPVENLTVGKPVVITVHIEPTEFTVPATQIRLTGSGTAQAMKFDGKGNVITASNPVFVDGAGSGTEVFQVTLDTSDPEIITAASGDLNVPNGSKMHVDVSKILDGSYISLDVLQVRSITIDGADPIYWDVNKAYTLPAGDKGTGASVAIDGGAASYVKYGGSIAAAATPVVITNGYVKVTVSDTTSGGAMTAGTNYTAIPGLLAGAVKGLPAAQKVTITNGKDTHNIAVTVTDSEGTEIASGTISCSSAVSGDATGATKGTLDVNVGSNDITIGLVGTPK